VTCDKARVGKTDFPLQHLDELTCSGMIGLRCVLRYPHDVVGRVGYCPLITWGLITQNGGMGKDCREAGGSLTQDSVLLRLSLPSHSGGLLEN